MTPCWRERRPRPAARVARVVAASHPGAVPDGMASAEVTMPSRKSEQALVQLWCAVATVPPQSSSANDWSWREKVADAKGRIADGLIRRPRHHYWPFSKEGDGPQRASESRIAPAQYGQYVFENFQREERAGHHPAEGLRLLAHAVQDSTMLAKYIPAVRAFLMFAASRHHRFMSCADVDIALATYLDWACFGDELSFSGASNCFFGMLAVFPELHSKLPIAHRAWKSWERNHLAGEGTPVPQEAAYIIAEWMRSNNFMLESLLTELIIDAYLRSGDWEKMRAADVYCDGTSVAIILGTSERGERTKTGPNQGVVLDSQVLSRDVLRLKGAREPQQRLFPFAPSHYRSLWNQAKAALKMEWLGPPHNLRHGGASRDLESKNRDLEGIRRRGRWKGLESVQRYTKVWVLAREREKLSKEQRTHGALLIEQRGQHSVAAGK